MSMAHGRGMVAALMLGAFPAGLGAQGTALSPAERARVDAVFKEHDKAGVPGCALGVMRGGRLAYARGYGMADLERRIPITPRTLFDVGSTSKQFTAAAIVLLALDGKLSLDDDVRRYVPTLPDYGAPITIDHLLRHTSGLRDYNGLLSLAGHTLEEATTDSQALDLVIRQRRLNFPTGSRHEYSNSGYFLMSVIVQRVTGKSLTEFTRERIFLPLGMKETGFRNDYAMLIPGRALGYAPNETGGFKNSMSNWEQTGDGALHLSIEDVLRWDQNFYRPRVGGAPFVARLQEQGRLANGDTISYARGLYVNQYRGLRRVEHSGDWVGYHAAYARFPDHHTSIAIFCNSDGIGPGELADRVADIVLARAFPKAHPGLATGKPAAAPPRPDTAAGLPLRDRLVGSYYADRTAGVYRVVADSGRLALNAFGRALPLSPTGPLAFAVVGIPVEVRFVAGRAGPARALGLRIGSGEWEEAMRFTPAAPAPEELRGYAGGYYSAELDATWPLVVENGRLAPQGPALAYLESEGGGEADSALLPAMKDAFTLGGGAFLRFTRDPSGRITGFDLSASRMRGIRFEAQSE